MERATFTKSDILSAYQSGLTIEQVGLKIGKSRSAVRHHLLSVGVTFRRTGPPLRKRTGIIPTDRGVLGYLAGLFDGEGNLYWRRRTAKANSIRITIYSTTAGVMDWLMDTLRCGYVRWDTKRTALHGWKPAARWELSATRDAIAVLDAMLPFLIIKRELATTVLADLRNGSKKP